MRHALDLYELGYSHEAVAEAVRGNKMTVRSWIQKYRPQAQRTWFQSRHAAHHGEPVPAGLWWIEREAPERQCDVCGIVLGRDGQTFDAESTEIMPGFEHSDPSGTRCNECLELYGDGPAALILGLWEIASPEESTVEEFDEQDDADLAGVSGSERGPGEGGVCEALRATA